jgi:HEAT repeat protein
MGKRGNRSRQGADSVILAALAIGKTVQESADAAGVSARTVSRRMADPDFCQRVAELRAETVARAASKMSDGMTEAADVLRKLLKSKKESIRLGSCRAMLEFGVRLRETIELQRRLEALEELARQTVAREESP